MVRIEGKAARAPYGVGACTSETRVPSRPFDQEVLPRHDRALAASWITVDFVIENKFGPVSPRYFVGGSDFYRATL